VRVTSSAVNEEKRILYESNADTFLVFTEAAWSEDENVVSILTCSTSAFSFAYDKTAKRMIPFTRMSHRLANQVRSDYKEAREVSSNREVLEWACSAGRSRLSKEKTLIELQNDSDEKYAPGRRRSFAVPAR
jgi:glutathionylspermidine synthase